MTTSIRLRIYYPKAITCPEAITCPTVIQTKIYTVNLMQQINYPTIHRPISYKTNNNLSTNHHQSFPNPMGSCKTPKKMVETFRKKLDFLIKTLLFRKVTYPTSNSPKYKASHKLIVRMSLRNTQTGITAHLSGKTNIKYILILLYQSSFHVVENSYLKETIDQKVSDSKAETIINIFGDILGSSANINTFDHVHGSSGSLGNGFVTSSQYKLHAQQDHIENPYKNSYTKKYAYGTSNNIVVNDQPTVDTNNVSMKKARS